MTNCFKPTILWAEDEPFYINLIREAVKEHPDSFHVAEAINGAAVLRLLDETMAMQVLPQLIVLDINMPGLDGRRTLISIITRPELKDVPKVLFSGSDSLLDKLFSMRYNVPLVFKSPHTADCKKAVKHILDTHLAIAAY